MLNPEFRLSDDVTRPPLKGKSPHDMDQEFAAFIASSYSDQPKDILHVDPSRFMAIRQYSYPEGPTWNTTVTQRIFHGHHPNIQTFGVSEVFNRTISIESKNKYLGPEITLIEYEFKKPNEGSDFSIYGDGSPMSGDYVKFKISNDGYREVYIDSESQFKQHGYSIIIKRFGGKVQSVMFSQDKEGDKFCLNKNDLKNIENSIITEEGIIKDQHKLYKLIPKAFDGPPLLTMKNLQIQIATNILSVAMNYLGAVQILKLQLDLTNADILAKIADENVLLETNHPDASDSWRTVNLRRAVGIISWDVETSEMREIIDKLRGTDSTTQS